MPGRLTAAVLAAAFVLVAGASAQTPPQTPPTTVSVTTFAISGHGWGHGVGMAQWGAYGYALHGFTYDMILAHYYPGAQLGPTPAQLVRVLVGENLRRVTVGSDSPFRVKDASAVVHRLEPGSYTFGPGLRLQGNRLPGPMTFLPGATPLRLAHTYRGSLIVAAEGTGKTMHVVDRLSLENYTRGVVSREMPMNWPAAALEAQAVAVRSYALAHRNAGPDFDVYADGRSQVYGGVEAETPSTDAAVAATKGEALLYDGEVADTFFSSSSGGRTAALTQVFPNEQPVPYLVSVPDPYDTLSPYHNWGPVPIGAAFASRKLGVVGVTALQPQPATGRASVVLVTGATGQVPLPASFVRGQLGLRSTWWSGVGVLTLARPAGVAVAGASLELTGLVTGVAGPVTIEQRTPDTTDWQPGPALTLAPDGSFSVSVVLQGTTLYRLVAAKVTSAVLRVPVGPA
jgi:stage II sporulation protein D